MFHSFFWPARSSHAWATREQSAGWLCRIHGSDQCEEQRGHSKQNLVWLCLFGRMAEVQIQGIGIYMLITSVMFVFFGVGSLSESSARWRCQSQWPLARFTVACWSLQGKLGGKKIHGRGRDIATCFIFFWPVRASHIGTTREQSADNLSLERRCLGSGIGLQASVFFFKHFCLEVFLSLISGFHTMQ